MVKSDKPEVIEQDVFGGKEKAVPGVVGRRMRIDGTWTMDLSTIGIPKRLDSARII